MIRWFVEDYTELEPEHAEDFTAWEADLSDGERLAWFAFLWEFG